MHTFHSSRFQNRNRRYSVNFFCYFPVALIVLFITLVSNPAASRGSSQFPVYPAIKDNVVFWERIYSHYSINSAVIHDRKDLSKVYGSINLLDRKLPGASKLNKAALKSIEKRYQKILTDLAGGKKASTKDEKRIAAMFKGKNRRAQMAEAAENVRSQTGQKERFREGVVRSGAYMTRLKKIFRSRGLPTELAYLPHVESSFNSKAYSKFGAAGMWQFTRATGKQYMVINEIIDERLDPFLSGDAAAKYLKNSYSKLNNWPMAITSYNYGLSGMMRARKEWGSYERIFQNYQKGHFGFASRNFYSEFVAALTVARKLEADPNVKRDKPMSFWVWKLSGYISLADLSRHFRLTKDTVKRYNPALKPIVLKGDKLIPKDYALRLPRTDSVSTLAKNFPRSYFSSSQRKNMVYRVKKGDSVSQIAEKHNIKTSRLIAANSLDRNGSIYIGQRLRIPGSYQAKPTSSKTGAPYLAADKKKQLRTKEGKAKPVTASFTIPVLSDSKKRTIAAIEVKRGGTEEVITVQPEESLGLYAQWLKIDEAKLRRLNKLDKLSQIEPGQRLTVPYQGVTAAEFAEQRAMFLHENEEDFFRNYKVVRLAPYTVRSGESLWELCNRIFNIPLWLLKKYNRDLDYRGIRAGQELTIPIVITIQ